jgi:hypothetical protein
VVEHMPVERQRSRGLRVKAIRLLSGIDAE